MENREVFGAKPLHGVDAKAASERANQLKQRLQNRMARHAQEFQANPVKTVARDSVRVASTGAGVTLGAAAVAAAPLMYIAHKGNKMYAKGSDSGKGIAGDSIHHMKNYTSNVILSPFKSDALSKANATYYSGLNEQKINRSIRDSVMSWFGLDEEVAQFDSRDRDQDMQELQALMEQKANEQRMKDEMERRNAGTIPMAISQAFRDPAIRNYLVSRDFVAPKEPVAADAFFKEAETSTAHDAPAENPSRPFEYTSDAKQAPMSGLPGIPETITPATPQWLNTENPPMPPFPNDGQEYIAYTMSPEIMMEYEAMQSRAMSMYPSMQNAIMNGQTKWKGIPDAIMMNDMKTLKEGAYLDYMAGGMEDGSISDVSEMDMNAILFEKQWADLESNEIDAEYGDRIRAYERGFSIGSKALTKSLSPENQRDLILQKAKMNEGKAAQFINNVRQFGKDIGLTKEDVQSVSRRLAADGLKAYSAKISAKNLSDASRLASQSNSNAIEVSVVKAIAPSVDFASMKDVSEPDVVETQAESVVEDRSHRALPSFHTQDETFSAADVLNGLRDRSKLNQAQPVSAPVPASDVMSL